MNIDKPYLTALVDKYQKAQEAYLKAGEYGCAMISTGELMAVLFMLEDIKKDEENENQGNLSQD